MKELKRFEELSEKEIKDLTENDIEKLINLECAQEGIKLLEMPEKPLKPKVDADREMFVVALNSSDSERMIFDNMNDAKEVMELLMSKNMYHDSYDWEAGYSSKYIENEPMDKENIQIKRKMFISENSFKERKNQLIEYQKKFKEYEERESEYIKIKKQRDKIVEKIETKIEGIKEKERIKNNMLKRYSEYLELANNNGEIAKRFLTKAYGESYIEEILGEKYMPKK
jgi:hypothetical protein